jgi:hypothetical protein
MPRPLLACLTLATLVAACGGDGDSPGDGGIGPITVDTPSTLSIVGHGTVTNRFTAEVWVRGTTAYTSTWGSGSGRALGNMLYIWDVAAATPTIVDTLPITGASTLGDVQVSDDGRLLVVATEFSPGSIVIYDASNARAPRQVSRFTSANTAPGVHTAEVARVNGTLYAFLSVDPSGARNGMLVIVDLSDPANPREVYAQSLSRIIHDVYVRDGLLFTALWSDGMSIWDIGGGGRGGSPSNPVRLGNVHTIGGNVHNIWWFHDPTNSSKRFAFVGEEGPAALGSSATGDIHVVDVTDLTSPREVGFYSVPGAGTHNFSVDEQRGILYAAYYNGGVRAVSIRGDLSSCSSAERAGDGRCDLVKMKREVAIGLGTSQPSVFVWGVYFAGSRVYASDMLGGLWALGAVN